ncbi:BrnT family toxin [Paracraurococcus lichenis]|uniref:BrnT family toxin n=1 Tax=Paracraurococcus lichenis TaxID=3064888 RepID=UPI00351D084B
MEFEWDEAKRLLNLAKHGLDFEDVDLIFEENHFTYDIRFVGSERRAITVGSLHGMVVALVSTRRGSAIRVISLRRARQDERRAYRSLYSR